MSRFKNTLESVSKAVSGTHSELVSRIARLKPHSGILSKSAEENRQGNTFHVTVGSDQQARSQEECDDSSNIKKPVVATGDLDPGGLSQGSLKDLADLKNSLFHVSYFATNFGETYNFLASHINWYFSTSVMDKDKKESSFPPKPDNQSGEALDSQEDDILSNENRLNAASALIPSEQSPNSSKTSATPPGSSKNRIANLLSYPSNSVQAFVDSYIGGLVPRLRSDTKSALQEKISAQEPEEILKEDEEAKSAEEKEKRLSLQREKASHMYTDTQIRTHICHISFSFTYYKTILLEAEKI